MASKFRPGLPEGFSINVAPVHDLGDYLDEPPPTPRPQRKAPEKEAPPAPTPQPHAQAVAAVTALAPRAEPAAENQPDPRPAPAVEALRPLVEMTPHPEPEAAQERAARPKGPRREISMTPETLRMSDELLDVIRSGSGQRDTKANELFHALVLLVHEAVGELEPHSIPKRGRWGTPTARAYPHELKLAFLRAVLRKYGGGEDAAAGERPVDDVA